MIRDAAIAFAAGRILAVGTAEHVQNLYRDAESIDFGRSLVLPGLVNAHTHLEHSDRSCGPRATGSFTDWLLAIRGGGNSAEQATRLGIAQCIRFGVTCVGDISQQVDSSRPALAASPLRAVSFGEVLGLARRSGRFNELLPRAISGDHATAKLRIGISPHAPYTVDLPGYRRCVAIAMENQLPLATHLAETPDETAFLESHTGPFRTLWERIGSWQPDVPTHRGSPIEMAGAIGLLDMPALLAHVNYCDDSEMDLLARGQASVVYCPRTHRYFGHPPHRWREMLRRGINVALGTDSCASSPNLNLIDDLRLLRQIDLTAPATLLWELVTLRAARALGWEHELGSLSPGKLADFVVFDARDDDPLEQVFRNDGQLPTQAWIGGLRVDSGAIAA